MEAIARLEPWRRGAYTGAFGYVGRAGSLELAVAIRTLQIDDGTSGLHDTQPKTEGRRAERRAFYFAGGGIVADSIPDVELEETRWKAMHIEGLGRLRPHPACTAGTP
jgi:anthranilate/para-aminobenzoate synthase component I